MAPSIVLGGTIHFDGKINFPITETVTTTKIEIFNSSAVLQDTPMNKSNVAYTGGTAKDIKDDAAFGNGTAPNQALTIGNGYAVGKYYALLTTISTLGGTRTQIFDFEITATGTLPAMTVTVSNATPRQDEDTIITISFASAPGTLDSLVVHMINDADNVIEFTIDATQREKSTTVWDAVLRAGALATYGNGTKAYTVKVIGVLGVSCGIDTSQTITITASAFLSPHKRVVTMLKDDWLASNVKKPEIIWIYDKRNLGKKLDLDKNDWVIVQPMYDPEQYADIFAESYDKQAPLKIWIKTSVSDDRREFLLNEVRRIIHLRRSRGFIDYDLITYDGVQHLSDRRTKTWKDIIDITLNLYSRRIG